MAISYVGGKGAGSAGQGGGSVSLTTGLSGGSGDAPIAGDLVVVTVSVGTANRQPTISISSPAGYTALPASRTTGTTYDTNVQTCYKVMGSTPDTTVTIPASGNIADGISYAIQVFRGVDQTTPLDVAEVITSGSAVDNKPNPGAITPVTAGAWIVCCGGGAMSAAGAVYTAGYLSNFLSYFGGDTTSGVIGVGYYTGWTSGSYDPAKFTGGNTNSNASWGATTIALRPASTTTVVEADFMSSGASLMSAVASDPAPSGTMAGSGAIGTLSIGGAAIGGWAPGTQVVESAFSVAGMAAMAGGISASFGASLSGAGSGSVSAGGSLVVVSAVSAPGSASAAASGGAFAAAVASSSGAAASDLRALVVGAASASSAGFAASTLATSAIAQAGIGSTGAGALTPVAAAVALAALSSSGAADALVEAVAFGSAALASTGFSASTLLPDVESPEGDFYSAGTSQFAVVGSALCQVVVTAAGVSAVLPAGAAVVQSSVTASGLAAYVPASASIVQAAAASYGGSTVAAKGVMVSPSLMASAGVGAVQAGGMTLLQSVMLMSGAATLQGAGVRILAANAEAHGVDAVALPASFIAGCELSSIGAAMLELVPGALAGSVMGSAGYGAFLPGGSTFARYFEPAELVFYRQAGDRVFVRVNSRQEFVREQRQALARASNQRSFQR